MKYSPLAIANAFYDLSVRSGRDDFTHMKVQKLVYISHGWNLGITESPLINEDVLAWRYGPVIQTIWNQYREFGRSPIDRLAQVLRYGESPEEPQLHDDDDWTSTLVQRMWALYGNLSGFQLSTMTHSDGSPWHTVASQFDFNLPMGVVIPQETIQQHYTRKWNDLHNNP